MNEKWFDIDNSKLDLCAYISFVIFPPVLFVASAFLEPIRGDGDIHNFATLVFAGSFIMAMLFGKSPYGRAHACGIVWAMGLGLAYSYLPIFVWPLYLVFPIIWAFRNRRTKR